MSPADRLSRTWVDVAIVTGLLAGVAYALPSIPGVRGRTHDFFFFAFGPLLVVASIGLYHFFRQEGRTVSNQIGHAFLALGGVAFTFMATMQMSIYRLVPRYYHAAEEADRLDWARILKGVSPTQLGLDFAFDIFVSVGTILIAIQTYRHPRFGRTFALVGVAIGACGLLANFVSFPENPGEAGLVDPGPFFGVWLSLVGIQVLRSRRWFSSRLAAAMLVVVPALQAARPASAEQSPSAVHEIEDLLRAGDHEAALAAIDQASDLDPGHRARWRAEAFLAAGDWKAAVEQGEIAAIQQPEDVRAQLTYARALRDKMQAVGGLKAAMVLRPYKRALAAALSLAPDAVDVRVEEIGFLIHAPGIAGGDRSKARRRIEALAALDAIQAAEMTVDLARAEGDPLATVVSLEHLVALAPEDGEARFSLAMSLQSLDRYGEADASFLIVLEGDDAVLRLAARYQLGRSRVLGGYELEAAVEHFDAFLVERSEASDRLPSSAAAHWRRGNALEALAQVEAAAEAYRRAVAEDPSLEQAREALAALNAR